MDPLTLQTSTGSIEVGDYLVCSHGKERCATCDVDHRDDNCFTAGQDPVGDRDSIEVEIHYNKDGQVSCKKHSATLCTSCYSFKKQIVKLNKDSVKKAKAKKGPASNFY